MGEIHKIPTDAPVTFNRPIVAACGMQLTPRNQRTRKWAAVTCGPCKDAEGLPPYAEGTYSDRNTGAACWSCAGLLTHAPGPRCIYPAYHRKDHR